jgi:hypothetical protein
VLADSPLACIRCAKAAFFSSSASGRPDVLPAFPTPAVPHPEDGGASLATVRSHERNVTMSRSKTVRMLW